MRWIKNYAFYVSEIDVFRGNFEVLCWANCVCVFECAEHTKNTMYLKHKHEVRVKWWKKLPMGCIKCDDLCEALLTQMNCLTIVNGFWANSKVVYMEIKLNLN